MKQHQQLVCLFVLHDHKKRMETRWRWEWRAEVALGAFGCFGLMWRVPKSSEWTQSQGERFEVKKTAVPAVDVVGYGFSARVGAKFIISR